MAGIIFTTSKQQPGLGQPISIHEGTHDCSKILRITSPNAHLKTRAHWILGWIPPREPAADHRFVGRNFIALRQWTTPTGFVRYWGYVVFDKRKNWGWVDQGNYKVLRSGPRHGAGQVSADYARYTERTLDLMQVAWRYRIPWRLPTGGPSPANAADEAYDRSHHVNARPVRVRVRVPFTDEQREQLKHVKKREERLHILGLEVHRNPWLDDPDPYDWNWETKKVRLEDGKPRRLDERLLPSRVEHGEYAEFNFSVRWAGKRGRVNWVLGNVGKDNSGWAFVCVPSLSGESFELNPLSKDQAELLKHPPKRPKSKGSAAAKRYEEWLKAEHYEDRRIQRMLRPSIRLYGTP